MPESFDLGSAQNSGPAVFVCDLPANPEQAEFELAQAETALQSNLASLQDSQARLDQLVHIQAGGVAFDVPGYPPSPGYPPGPGYSPGSPESQLLALLGTSVPDGEWDPSSFGAGEAVSGQWQKIAVGFQEFMDRLNQVVGHFAWVETQINGKLIVRSSVGWTGNLDTAWNAAPTHESAALHQRTLRLALTSRTAMLRAFGVISAGAVKLTALVASPAGAVLALPAAWNFIRQVQAESARYASIKQEIGNG
ncbi:MAG TPA: hypothetical protein VN363_08065 [Anaerolineales bacterium]|nr:hypothetical protein [Anaerolineales bacterium]